MHKLNSFIRLVFTIFCIVSSCLLHASEIHNQIEEAIYERDVKRVQSLLKSGVDINTFDPQEGQPLLNIALREEQEKIIDLILDAGADASLVGSGGVSALEIASYTGNVNLVKRLVKAGARPQSFSSFNQSYLQIAIANEYFELAEYYIDQGVDINHRDESTSNTQDDWYDESPMDRPIFLALGLYRYKANYSNDEDKVFASKARALIENLLSKDVKLDLPDVDGNAAIFKFLDSNDEALVSRVLKQSASIQENGLQAKDENGNTALIIAVRKGMENLAVQMLNGSDLSIKDALGRSLAEAAYQEKLFVLVEKLIREKAELATELWKNGQTLVHQAYLDKHLAQAKSWAAIVTQTINSPNSQGNTLLHLSVLQKDVQFSRWLLSQGADANVFNEKRSSPVSLAVMSGELPLVNALIDKADTRLRYADEASLMHLAVPTGNLDIIKRLAEKGVEFNDRDQWLQLPAHTAINHGQKAILEYLVEHYPKPKIGQSYNGKDIFADPRVEYWSLLYWAGKNDNLKSSLEADLASSSPSMLAAKAWVSLLDNKNELSKALQDSSITQAPWFALVEKTAQIEILASEERTLELLQRYPVETRFLASDLFAVIDLAYAAANVKDYELKYRYLEKSYQLAPEFWQLNWMFEDISQLRRKAIQPIAQQIINLPVLKGTESYDYIAKVSGELAWDAVDELVYIDKWLEKHSFDTRAHAAMTYALKGLNQYEKALQHAQRAVQIFPFYSNRDLAPELLMRLGRYEQANAHIQLISHWYEEKDSAVLAARYTAEAYIDDGDYGAARKALEKALTQWPEEADLVRAMAKLEVSDKRYSEAASQFRKYLRLEEKPSSDDFRRAISAYSKAGEKPEALALAKTQLDKNAYLSEDLLKEILDLAKDLDNTALTRTALQRAEEIMPGSYEMAIRRIKNQANNKLSNTEILALESLLQDDPYGPANSLWSEYVLELHGEKKHETQLEARLARYPQLNTIAKALLKYQGNSSEEKLHFWKGADLNAGQTFFSVFEQTDIYVAEHQYVEGKRYLDGLLSSIASGEVEATRKQLNDVLLNYMWLLERWSKRKVLTNQVAEDFAKALAQYEENNFSAVNLARYSESYFRSQNDLKAAAQAHLQESLLNKSSTSIFHDLIAKYSQQLTKLQTQGYGYRMLQRNPYGADYLESYLHKQLLWGGSAINALKAIEEAKARGISYNRYYERRALNNLGDSMKLFESYRLGNTTPGSSQRYINWFEHAREEALTKERKEIRYNFDEGKSEVSIVHANGEVMHREDHPIFGVITKFRKGASWIEVKYDAEGHMTDVIDSGGEFIRLRYDGGQISLMEDSKGAILSFSYNDIGKPEIIQYHGVGNILVSYDRGGEIERVHSEQGHKIALKVTQAFQNLLSVTNRIKNIYRTGKLPEIGGSDPQLETLESAYQEAQSTAESGFEAKTAFALARYLVEHVENSSDYANKASDLLLDIFYKSKYSDDKKSLAAGVEAVQLWHELYRQYKPHGVPKEDFSQWSELRMWLASVALEKKKYRKVLQQIDSKPIVLLKDAHWLTRSDINNSAFWRRFGNSDIYPTVAGIEKQAVLIRENGDMLVGTTKGFAVLRSGFWEWFDLDVNSGQFSLTPTQAAGINVLSLAETQDGVLWIGTSNGLYALTDEYSGDLKRWKTKADGLPSPRVDALHAHGSLVYLGTPKGLLKLDFSSSFAAPEKGFSQGIVKIASVKLGEDKALLVQEKNRLVLVQVNGEQTLIHDNVTDFTFEQGDAAIYWLTESRIFESLLDYDNNTLSPGEPSLLGLTNELNQSKAIYELNIWNIPGAGNSLVVNSDTAVNVLKDRYFQSLRLPFEVSRAGLQVGPKLSFMSQQGDVIVATDDGVYAYQPTQVKQHAIGRIHDIVVDNGAGITYLATGNGLYYVDQADVHSTPKFFDSSRASQLILDQQGNLITNDGLTILRYPRGETSPTQLFSASQDDIDKKWKGGVNHIVVDSQNTIWVAAGSSVFRYNDSMEAAEEYNYFKDSDRFPSRSEMIYRIYENFEGKIHVVASNESHLSHHGVSLTGGLLQWKNGAFENLGNDGHWFVTGYTKISEDTAIVSTNKDFVRERRGDRQSYKEMNDPTYNALKEKSSMIWLGQEGSQMENSNTWIFPSAGGVVVYHQGQWFYPDRINQLLPDDQALGQYGGRTVHAVAADKQNQIYVGTDLGLLVYNSEGVVSLLTDNHQGQIAFSDFNVKQQQEVKDILLSKLDPKTEQGKLIARYQKLQDEIDDIEQNMQAGSSVNAAGNASGATSEKSSAGPSNHSQDEKFKQRLKARERSRQKLLANLERNHYGLFQMLKMDPREIAAMHEKLTDKQALVQYLPTKNKLVIQVVTREGAVIREVEVSEEKLYANSLAAAKIMRSQLHNLQASSEKRGIAVKQNNAESAPVVAGPKAHVDSLRWLYHHLFRPIENDLVGKDQVFITPVGALTYVPFSALVRSAAPQPEYLVERYNVGVLPSMYHFNLVMQQNQSYSDKALFVADPDGSLPGARLEVEQISAEYLFDNTVLEGEQASLASINEETRDARIVHFATHGILDSQSPGDSYLLLAGSQRLSVIDISTMDLEQTDLVVLSACESGIGQSGMEYATLARAFAHAKVPSVVASYWKVHDDATQRLMTLLYQGLNELELDYFAAIAYAKKEMLKAEDGYSHPAAWASFEVFGKP